MVSFSVFLCSEQHETHRTRKALAKRGLGCREMLAGRYKLINELSPSGEGATPWELYDLEADPGETEDLAEELPVLTAELIDEWEKNWRR